MGVEQPQKTETFHEGIDTSVTELIASAYNLSDLMLVGVSDKGVSSNNLILKTSNGNRYFLKQYKKNDAENRDNAHRVEQHIALYTSVPVILPLETHLGESYTHIGGKMYALFEYKDHITTRVEVEEEVEQTYLAGKTLGLIHAAPVSESIQKCGRWEPKAHTERVERLQMIKEIIQAKETQDEYDKLAMHVIMQKQALLMKFENSIVAPSEYGICHGDYHAENILFDKDREVIGVCDWDSAGVSDQYVDLANAFVSFVIKRNYESYQTDREQFAKAFLEGYLEGNPKPLDINHLKNGMSKFAATVVMTSWPMYDHYIHHHTKGDSALKGVEGKVAFYNEHNEEISDFIIKILSEIEKT